MSNVIYIGMESEGVERQLCFLDESDITAEPYIKKSIADELADYLLLHEKQTPTLMGERALSKYKLITGGRVDK